MGAMNASDGCCGRRGWVGWGGVGWCIVGWCSVGWCVGWCGV